MCSFISKTSKAGYFLKFIAFSLFILHLLTKSNFLFEKSGKYSFECNGATPCYSTTVNDITIFVNLDIHRMYVYENMKLVSYLFVSGGVPSSPSPCGHFFGSMFSSADSANPFVSIFTPWSTYHVCNIYHSKYADFPTGINNFSDGDLYLSVNDYNELVSILGKSGRNFKINIQCNDYKSGTNFREMKCGMTGSDILEVQNCLYNMKFLRKQPDGIFDEMTKKAVKSFQSQACLFITGEVNRFTYKQLVNSRVNSAY